MIKIGGKRDKSDTYKRFSSNISFLFMEELLQTSVNKEQNITTKPIVNV